MVEAMLEIGSPFLASGTLDIPSFFDDESNDPPYNMIDHVLKGSPQYLPESPESLPVAKKRRISDSSKSSREVVRNAPLAIQTDSEDECDGEPATKRRKNVPTRSTGMPYGLYVPSGEYFAPEDFKHTCVDDQRVVIGPEYDCGICQWKHLLKPVKAVMKKVTAAPPGHSTSLKKLKVEHPQNARTRVKAKTKPFTVDVKCFSSDDVRRLRSIKKSNLRTDDLGHKRTRKISFLDTSQNKTATFNEKRHPTVSDVFCFRQDWDYVKSSVDKLQGNPSLTWLINETISEMRNRQL